jgi:protein-disulfide isomerase-like protein with CxxC motif
VALTSREQVGGCLEEVGLDAGEVFALVDDGQPRQVIAERWRHYHDELDVFGVPTFVVDDADATFVRLMDGPDPAAPAASVAVVERLLSLIVSHPEINELKHTRLSR